MNFPFFRLLVSQKTWLNEHNSALLDIPGYIFYHRNRQFRQHGGIGDYIRSDIKVLVRSDLVLFHEMLFEPFILQLRLKPIDVYVVVLYRPPSGSIPALMDILEEQLDKLPIGSHPFFMLRDFNIDLNDMNSNTPKDFLQLCMSYSLFPTINICTRVTTLTAKLLDNILFNYKFSDQGVLVTGVSDHFGISASFKVCFPRQQGPRLEMSMLPVLNQGNLEKFKQEISNVHWNNVVENLDDINISFQRFYDTLISVLSKTCILSRTRSRKKIPKKSWLSPSLLQCINKKDQLYRDSIDK